MKKLRSHYKVHRLEVLPQVYTCTHTQCRSYLALEVFYTCIKAPSFINRSKNDMHAFDV